MTPTSTGTPSRKGTARTPGTKPDTMTPTSTDTPARKRTNAHSEFHARYRYECKGSAIGTIGVRLFEHWPHIKEIRVQALTPDGQFGGGAKADDPVIKLR